MNKFNMQVATREKALELLSECRTEFSTEHITEKLDTATSSVMLITQDAYEMLFEYSERSEGVCDVHVLACPLASRVASRALALASMLWVTEKMQAKALISNCPEGKIADFGRSLGFIEIGTLGSDLVFMATPAQLELKYLNLKQEK